MCLLSDRESRDWLVLRDRYCLLSRKIKLPLKLSSQVELAPSSSRPRLLTSRQPCQRQNQRSRISTRESNMSAWPKLPAKAAYLALRNPKRRNALSLAVLQDLKTQLQRFNTSPSDGQVRILPPFRPELLSDLESASADEKSSAGEQYDWLVSASAWKKHREGLPNVIVLRSEGPVFSAGHDLSELRQISRDDVKLTFSLCAEVMSMIRRSPMPVIGAIHALATAAGCQLALTTDLPIAKAETQFRLPGSSMGLPCTSPSTAVGRRLGNPFTYRM